MDSQVHQQLLLMLSDCNIQAIFTDLGALSCRDPWFDFDESFLRIIIVSFNDLPYNIVKHNNWRPGLITKPDRRLGLFNLVYRSTMCHVCFVMHLVNRSETTFSRLSLVKGAHEVRDFQHLKIMKTRIIFIVWILISPLSMVTAEDIVGLSVGDELVHNRATLIILIASSVL